MGSLHEEYGAGLAAQGGPAGGGYATAWGLLAAAERRYKQQVEPAVKAAAAAQADAVARHFQALRAALPEAAPPAAPDAIGAATAGIGAALESSLGLARP